MTSEEAFNLPSGMAWGDPVWIDDILVGHTRQDGTAYNIVVDDETYHIAWAIDTPEGQRWLKTTKRKAPDDKQFNVRIGGGPGSVGRGFTASHVQTEKRRFHYSGAIDGHADENDNFLTLITGDPDVVRAFDEGKASNEMLTETIERLFARGLGHREIEIETNDPRMTPDGGESARMTLTKLAERFPKPRAQRGQDAISQAVSEVMAARYGVTPAGPADRMFTERGMNLRLPNRPSRGGRLLNSETGNPFIDPTKPESHPINRAINALIGPDSDKVSVEQWAHDVNEEARRQGYSGPEFTPEIAQFYRDVYSAGGGEEQLVREFFRSMDSSHFGEGHCDFCNDTDPLWEYPCEDFQIPTPTGEPYVSEGAWAACERCASLIDRSDRLALVNRYVNTKPRQFRDLLRPWTTRLHNQFYRHRNGDKRHAKSYIGRVIDEADRRAGKGGEINVISADDLEAARAMGAEDIARRVRETGEVAMVTVDNEGNREVVAEGDHAVDHAIDRRVLTNAYRGHPLVDRYMQHVNASRASHGLWRNTEGWMALAEKYVSTFTAALTLGLPPMQNMPRLMFFDPGLINSWPDDGTRKTREEAMGLYLARALHDSVPYLWTEKCDQLAAEPDLPVHHVTRGLTPHPAMFWSFETALGIPEARIDWMLILETARGYEVWCPQANDVTRDGSVMITGALIPYGAKWPDTLANQPAGDLAQFLLKRLAFLNSKYVETPRMRPHRSLRREVERNLKPQHEKPPEDYSAFVVHLRSPEPRPALSEVEGPGRDFKRLHCWWRRAHTRVIFRKTPNERAVYVSAALCGDTNLPLIRKTYVVDH